MPGNPLLSPDAFTPATPATPERYLDVKPLAQLVPVYGVSDLPLTTLGEAVKPLVSLVPNIESQASSATQFFAGANVPHDIDAEQAAALRVFTNVTQIPEHSLYEKLNEALQSRDRTLITPYFRVVRLVSEAIKHLPKWDPSTPLWRGLPQDMCEEYAVDKEFTWWPYTITSSNEEKIRALFGENADMTIFRITGADNAVQVTPYSDVSDEDEVILPAGTILKVTAVTSPSTNVHVVELVVVKTKYPAVA